LCLPLLVHQLHDFRGLHPGAMGFDRRHAPRRRGRLHLLRLHAPQMHSVRAGVRAWMQTWMARMQGIRRGYAHVMPKSHAMCSHEA